MSAPKYPDVHVQLTGEDGNAFFILGKIQRILKKEKLFDSVWEEFYKEATSGDYNHLLATVMMYFTVS